MQRVLTTSPAAVFGAILMALGLAGPASAQDLSAVLAGYGSANYQALLADNETPNDFSAQVSPILLFQMGEDILFETEIEFELEGAETETALEYAQIDYLGFDSFQITAGKFLLPFGVFGERLHPTWINKMPDAPPIYGHAHGGVAEGAVLPILADAGLMIRYAQPMGEVWKLDVSAWVSQGPRLAEEGAGHEEAAAGALAPADEGHGDEEPGMDSMFDIPDVAFGVSFGDNNENKMLGGRIGFGRGDFEVLFSAFHAMVDPDDFLDLTGFNLAAEFRRGPFELRGEGVLLRQEFVQDETYETVERPGFYAQAARRIGDFEPVLRWTRLLDAEVDGETAIEGFDQVAFGLDYWITPTVPVKLAYQANVDRDDRVLLQWAFGF